MHTVNAQINSQPKSIIQVFSRRGMRWDIVQSEGNRKQSHHILLVGESANVMLLPTSYCWNLTKMNCNTKFELNYLKSSKTTCYEILREWDEWGQWKTPAFIYLHVWSFIDTIIESMWNYCNEMKSMESCPAGAVRVSLTVCPVMSVF